MKTLVVFGDSNSYGTPGMPDPDFWGRFGPDERWPGVARQSLGSDWALIEEGLPGRTTVHDDPIEGLHKNGSKALPIVLESHRPIDVLAIMLGTNDLKARFSVTPEDVANSVGVLVRTVQASQAGPAGRAPAVIVIAPPPTLEAGFMVGLFKGAAEKSKTLGRCIGAVAGRLGATFIDAGTLIESDPIDGIHLSRESHAVLGRAVAERIRSAHPRTSGDPG